MKSKKSKPVTQTKKRKKTFTTKKLGINPFQPHFEIKTSERFKSLFEEYIPQSFFESLLNEIKKILNKVLSLNYSKGFYTVLNYMENLIEKLIVYFKHLEDVIGSANPQKP